MIVSLGKDRNSPKSKSFEPVLRYQATIRLRGRSIFMDLEMTQIPSHEYIGRPAQGPGGEFVQFDSFTRQNRHAVDFFGSQRRVPKWDTLDSERMHDVSRTSVVIQIVEHLNRLVPSTCSWSNEL